MNYQLADIIFSMSAERMFAIQNAVVGSQSQVIVCEITHDISISFCFNFILISL